MLGKNYLSRSRVLNANLASKVDAFPFVRFDDVEKGGPVPVFSPLEVFSGSPLDEAVDLYLFPPRDIEEQLPLTFKSFSAQPKLDG